MKYTCSDCQKQAKIYSLQVTFSKDSAPFINSANTCNLASQCQTKSLKLFDGEDAENFKKGRRCESQGLGIGAFADYRRVVEKHKNDIFDAIIKVCNTLGSSSEVIADLEEAKKEIQFTTSVEKIKSALPQGLLINGHNSLLAMHGALSVGLHNESDENCRQAAKDVRIVLADLVEKISSLKQDNVELSSAVQRLLQKKASQD